MKVSRRTYRFIHFLLFALPMFTAAMIWVQMGDETVAQLVVAGALLCAVLGAFEFVRAWRETER